MKAMVQLQAVMLEQHGLSLTQERVEVTTGWDKICHLELETST